MINIAPLGIAVYHPRVLAPSHTKKQSPLDIPPALLEFSIGHNATQGHKGHKGHKFRDTNPGTQDRNHGHKGHKEHKNRPTKDTSQGHKGHTAIFPKDTLFHALRHASVTSAVV